MGSWNKLNLVSLEFREREEEGENNYFYSEKAVGAIMWMDLGAWIWVGGVCCIGELNGE